MHKIRFPLIVFIIWKAIQTLYLAYLQPYILITEFSETKFQRLYIAWVSRWDSVFYLQIAWKGYGFPNQAFFPLFPGSIKLLSLLGVPLDTAAFFLANLCALSTFILFYLVAEKVLEKSTSKQALICFVCFPATLFLNASYAEGLFLAVTLLSFLLYEKGLYLASALFSGLSAGTRIVGIVTASQFLFLKKSLPRKLLLMIIATIGLTGYMLYLLTAYRNPFLFVLNQKGWMDNGTVQVAFSQILNAPILFSDWVFTILFLAVTLPVYKILGKRYALYTLGVILIPLFRGSTISMSRYVIAAFPVFFVLPQLMKSKAIFIFFCVLLAVLQILFISNFINNIWIG